MSGINKIADPQGAQQYMAAMGITIATTFLYAGVVFLEVAGGLSLLLGVWAKWGATALILFMIPTTLIFHHRRCPWKPRPGRDHAKYPADWIPALAPIHSAGSPYPRSLDLSE